MSPTEPTPLERKSPQPLRPEQASDPQGKRYVPQASKEALQRRVQRIQDQDVDENEELMVLEDLDNGKEYYLSEIDRFPLNGRSYAVMVSYEPENESSRIPDLVIMRYRFSEEGQQFYHSIRDEEELDEAFDVFYQRLEEGLGR